MEPEEELAELSVMQKEYKAAMDRWVAALRAEEELALVDPTAAQVDEWEELISGKTKLETSRNRPRRVTRTRFANACSNSDHCPLAFVLGELRGQATKSRHLLRILPNHPIFIRQTGDRREVHVHFQSWFANIIKTGCATWL